MFRKRGRGKGVGDYGKGKGKGAPAGGKGGKAEDGNADDAEKPNDSPGVKYQYMPV